MNPSQPPYFPPPQKKTSSSFIPIFLGLACLFFGSCGIWLAYDAYKESTPEGKKAAKERDEQKAATLDAFLVKMAHVREGLPAVDAPAENCPAGTTTALAPIVDSFFFDSLQDGRGDAGRIPRTSGDVLARDSLFSNSILDAELSRAGIDAGPQIFTGTFGLVDIETLSKKPVVLVIDVADFEPPKNDTAGFIGGELEGSLDVVDFATDKTICHAPISPKSSDSIDYGGGMSLKFHGIPSPTIGKTDLDEALTKDFKTNVEAAAKRSLAAIGAK